MNGDRATENTYEQRLAELERRLAVLEEELARFLRRGPDAEARARVGKLDADAFPGPHLPGLG
jgi:hypothetical protein